MKPQDRLTKGKVFLFTVLTSFMFIILVIATAETYLRLRYHKIAGITGMNEWKEGSGSSLTFYWDRYHPVYGWTNLPGYRSDARVPFKVTINSQGLRGQQEYSQHPAAGVRRIAVLGDSTTFGEDVDDDQTLPYYLERFIHGSEVLNFGAHGYGLDQMVLVMEREVFAYNPDHILIVLSIPPDLERTVLTGFTHPKPAFSIENGKLVAINIPVPISLHQQFMLRHSYAAAWLFGRPREKHKDDSMILPVSRALIEKAALLCLEADIPLTIVLIAAPAWTKLTEQDGEIKGWFDESRQMVHGIGVEVSDQIDFLRQIRQQGQDVSTEDDVHWSGRGNCLLAGNLTRELVENDPSLKLSENVPQCAPVFPTIGVMLHK